MTLANAESLRLVTWNVWHGFGPGPVARETSRERDARAAVHSRTLRNFAADAVLLQECNPLLARAADLGRELNSTWAGQMDAVGVKLFGVGVPRGLDAGLVTLARHGRDFKNLGAISLLNPRVNLVRPRLSLQVREERFAHFSSIRTAGSRRVLLVNTQLHDGFEWTVRARAWFDQYVGQPGMSASAALALHRRLSRGDRRRRRELTHLLTRVKALEAGYDLVVIAGDFNVTPTGDAADVKRAAGYVDAWAAARPTDPGFTYDLTTNALNRAVQDAGVAVTTLNGVDLAPEAQAVVRDWLVEHERRPRRVDYLWVKARNSVPRVTAAARVGSPDDESTPSSDHYGLEVELELGP